MSLTVGKYTFGAWLRKGIGRDIIEPDTLGASDGTTVERASVPVEVQVNSRAVSKTFPLMGPGDVRGINPANVVRTEPRDWVTDFEPNYLAFIEFYEEDFLWRFTPASPSGHRLRPWFALAVLEEQTATSDGEFTRTDKKLPLTSIKVKSSASLPSHEQTWAWAHVHTNASFTDATEFELFLDSLKNTDHPNSDRITGRLMSPRRLAANTAYGAFVVPVFETGRLAGLGQDPTGVSAQQSAWSAVAGPVELPVFYEWRFRTGEREDFESMVERLEPRIADSQLGIRPMDGEYPGWGLTQGTDIGQIVPADEKQTVLGLEGALKAPTTRPRPAVLDSSRPFLAQLTGVLNAPEARRSHPSTESLPVIAPPIYGEHHARRHTVSAGGRGWLDLLNIDPRNRVSAGFGVRVVREHQENYVARAWKQVQRILEANRLILLAAHAMRVSETLYANLGARLPAAQRVTFFGAVLRKVRGSPTTLQHQLNQSTLPPSALSGAMRRLIRPRGGVGRRVATSHPTFSHADVVHGLADGTLSAAPPKRPGDDLETDTGVVEQLPPPSLPGCLMQMLRHRWMLVVLVLLLVLLPLLSAGAWAFAIFAVALAVVLIVLAEWWVSTHPIDVGPGPGVLVDPGILTDVLQRARPRDAFTFVETDPVAVPQADAGTQVTTTTETTSDSPDAVSFEVYGSFTPGAPGEDSAEGAAFRTAATALSRRLSFVAPAEARPTFDLGNASAKIATAVDPLRAFPLRVAATVDFGRFDAGWLRKPEHLVPAMAYPDFDDPMYEKLRDLSSELLLPNLKLIPPNSITLLETNPPFIEAYLTGLNTEFGKELLWREYPTDRRGSYFRQFWDVRGLLETGADESEEAASERSKDITPHDTWLLSSRLGTHRNPLRPAGEQVVLTVRGDVLKKYPGTLIYAQKAHIARDADGNPQPDQDPVLGSVESEADIDAELEFPVFGASVEPDIRFFGFDLSVEQAYGDENPQTASDDWGYFFVIQQLPGEPRFGMDITFSPDDDESTPITWNDLAWTLFPDGQNFIDTAVGPSAFTPAGPGESADQWGDDSARMASILFQAPVMIAVHAKEMLEGLG